MAYCTVNDIKDHVPADVLRRISNDTDEDLSVNVVLINSIIQEQSDLIDSYLRTIYLLPITNTADLNVLNSICHDLTIGELFQRRYPLEESDTNKNRRKTAIDSLNNLILPAGTQRLVGANQKMESTYISVSSSPKFASEKRLNAFMKVGDSAIGASHYYEQDIKGWRR